MITFLIVERKGKIFVPRFAWTQKKFPFGFVKSGLYYVQVAFWIPAFAGMTAETEMTMDEGIYVLLQRELFADSGSDPRTEQFG